MLQASKILSQGAGLAPVLVKRASSIALDWAVRQKSRFDATDSLGRTLGVSLPPGTLVRGGDVLLAEDGSMVKVIAAPQALLHITHCAKHGAPSDLLRAAYHLGKGQVPIEIKPDHLKIEPDQILAAVLRAMHLIVHDVNEAFEPEGVAGSAGGHADADADADADERAKASSAKPATQPAHVHGPDCKHDHGHNQAEAVKPVAIQIHKHKPHKH